MPLRLKNAGSTYQLAMTTLFHDNTNVEKISTMEFGSPEVRVTISEVAAWLVGRKSQHFSNDQLGEKHSIFCLKPVDLNEVDSGCIHLLLI